MDTRASVESLLRRSAPGGARLLVSRLLRAAARAAPRLRDKRDSEALHDFRVSLRRLRTVLRFYHPHLTARVSKKDLKLLKRIAASTGTGRDAEVQIAHLKGFEAELACSRRHASAWLRARIAAKADTGAVRQAERAFLALEARLRPSLLRRPLLAEAAREAHGPDFGRVTADLLLSAASKLQRDLASIRSAHDVERAHLARISGKRLRYLMEPLSSRSSAWVRAGKELKGLQDVLGELHDMHVLLEEISMSAEQHAVERVRQRLAHSPSPRPLSRRAMDPLPGLALLSGRVRRKEAALHRRLGRSWGELRKARFFGSLFSLAEGIR